jgi:FtsP/CotA-like multicopper oxidase with cupredoxin domain
MKSNAKMGVKVASGQARFKLLTSTAMVAMALASMSAMAGSGKVCLENNNDSAAGPLVAHSLTNCSNGTINTYYANSPKLRKFVDTLPGLTTGNPNKFDAGQSGQSGEYLSVGVADTTTYPGSNYFIIGVVEHTQWMHSDLQKPTMLRGYVQLYPRLSERPAAATNPPTKAVDTLTGQVLPEPVALTYPDGSPIYWPNSKTTATPLGEQVYAYNKPNYLGPTILTMSGTPVRAQMVNLLPTGRATPDNNGSVIARNGDIFLPVDESLGGAGLAPTPAGAPADKYPQNRAAFHLHGGDSPWISDGTPHQWITPAADPSPYKAGSRVMNAPDMPFPGEGSLNVYWANDQSARLMWYHDHTFGLTRQNAYGGEAAGYVIMDAAELALLGLNADLTPAPTGVTIKGNATQKTIQKAIPNGLLDQIVLVIQDKTFVPTDIGTQDSKWDTKAWGQPGDLWYPHVYEPFQLWGTKEPLAGTDPADPANNIGTNPAGRWDYAVNDGNGFYLPPKVGATRADTDYGMVAFPDGSYADGTQGKGPSATPESYMDTPVINGVAYPVMNVEPKAYRVRFLNGANDRYWNLSLWKAATSPSVTDPVTRKATAPNTEVKIIPFGSSLTDTNGNLINTSNDPAGIPDPSTAGPSIIQFANEAGFLPQPVVHKPTLMSFDSTGVEIAGDFYLAAAERADTVIDFSQFAGQTLIMYNDGTAPVPGGDARYDYYTGDADQSAFGGAPTTEVGYGPNTRTLMQIRVASTVTGSTKAPTPDDAYECDRSTTPCTPLPGGPLSSELPKVYTVMADPHVVGAASTAADQNIGALPTSVDASANTMLLAGSSTPVPLTIKTIHGYTDGNVGRLIAQLGTELPLADGTAAPTPLSYIDMPTEILSQDEIQYWWIKNYDVDNHPMHFHLFNVQVLAHRLHDANGTLRPPTPEEMGWKETVKNWPGEDVIVAVKPKTPQLPFGLPNSVRNLDPTMHTGATANDVLYGTTVADGAATPYAFAQFELDPLAVDANGQSTYGASKSVSNTEYNFGWEYVWHCHILGHEENDLMRPMVFKPVINAPAAPSNVTVDTSKGTVIKWTDPTPAYQISAAGAPVLDVNGLKQPEPKTKGNNTNEIGFRVERAEVTTSVDTSNNLVYTPKQIGTATDATGATAPIYFAQIDLAGTGDPIYKVVDGRVNTLANATSFVEQAPVGADYLYRVVSVNEAGETASPDTSYASYSTAPIAPTGVAVTSQGLVSWTDASSNEIGFRVERAPVTHGTVGVWTPATLNNTLANATSFQDTPPASTDFNYRVVAVSAGGETVSTGIAALYAAPAAPSALTVLVNPAVTATTLTLQWQVNATNDEGYLIEANVNGAGFTSFATVTVNTTAVVGSLATYAATVNPGTSYNFRVSAIKSSLAGYQPTYSYTTNAVTTPATLVAPVVTALANANGGATINWTTTGSSGQNGFTVERCAGTATTCAAATASWTLLTTETTTATTYTDTTALASGATYVYRVKLLFTAIGATTPFTVGVVGRSAAVAPTIGVVAPTNLTATSPTGVGVTLTWLDNSTNETSFNVVRTPAFAAAVSVTRNAAAKTATGGTVTYADATAVAGTSYTYTVAAVSTAGTTVSTSLNSNTASIYLVPVPTSLKAVQSGANISLSWIDASPNETAFEVIRTDLTPGSTASPVTYVVARTAAQATSVKTAVTYLDTVAATGVTYSYAVRGVYTPTVVPPATVAVSSYSPLTASVTAAAVLPAPTKLVATSVTTGGVALSWTDNATFETGYRVDRADVTNGVVGAFAEVGSVAGTAVTGPVAFADTTAATGVTYAYQVVALNGTAASAPSNTASNAPVAAGTPTGLTAVTTSGTSVVLSWIDNSTNETSFLVTRTDAANVVKTFTVARSTTQIKSVGTAVSYSDTTAVLGTSYSYTVTAVIPAAGATAGQNLVSAPVTAMLTVNAPTAATAVQTATGITIAWTDNANNEIGFQIVRTGVDAKNVAVAAATFNVTSTTAQKTATGARSFIDTTAVPGVSYTYTVAATSGTAAAPVPGIAVATNPLSITEAIVAPSVPTAVVTNGTSITVTWADLSTNETGFLVERSMDGGLTFKTLATVARTGTATTTANGAVSYVDRLVAPIVYGQYLYRVSAVNVTGTGTTAVTNAASTAVTSNVVDFTLPAIPAALTVTAGLTGSGAVTLAWTDVATNETGYTIQRATNTAFTAGLVTTAVPGAVAGGNTSYVLNGMTVGTKYFFRVAATNAVGTSAYVASTVAVAVP